MAKRRPPATTPFGAWLSEWFDDHPDEWTVEAFAAEVGVSASAVSLWFTKTKRVGVDHLREVARVTGEDFEVIYRMVYTRKAPALPPPDLPPGVTEAIAAAVAEAMQPLLSRLDELVALLEADRGGR